MSKSRVVIYTRPGCHLCEEAKEATRVAGCAGEYTLNEINIETDSELLGRYGDDVPVITIDGVEAFRHSVSAEEFRERLLSNG